MRSVSTLLIATLASTALLSASAPERRAPEGEEGPTYVGAITCRKCHKDQYEAWSETKMSKAFDLLLPGERAEEKKANGLDPQKDYTRDPDCLRCHVTGWGKPGGYAIPQDGDSPEAIASRERAELLKGVQCEVCHGPGSMCVEFKSDNMEYKWSDLEQRGLLSGVLFPTEETCHACHNEENPFKGEKYEFEFEKRKEQGTHVHKRLDFDHGCPHQHTPTKKKGKRSKSSGD